MNETATKPRPDGGAGNATPAQQLPARASFRRLAECTTLAQAFETRELRDLIAQAAPDFMKPDAMLRTWIQAASKSPDIYKADLRQALGCFQSLAYLGLVPNTHLNHAYIIPFKTKRYNPATRQRDIDAVDLQVIIGYPGYIELAHRSGYLRSIHCDVVYDERMEGFSVAHGSNKHLNHAGMPPGFVPQGDPVRAYAFARLADDDQFEVMTWHEVLAIRNRSQAYRFALAAKEQAEAKGWRVPATWTEAPWVRDAAEMGKKTALRRLFKTLPKCPEVRAAAALEDAQDRGGRLDFGPVIDGAASPLDGNIPDAPDDGPTIDGDPGATFTDRREGGGAPQQSANLPAQPRQSPPPSRTEPTPYFEAVMLDEGGMPLSDKSITDATIFATRIADIFARLPAAQREAFLEFNADAIEDARQFPRAAAILAAFEDAPDQEEDSAWTPEPVIPPADRGRLSWSGYTRLIREALPRVPTGALLHWLEAQHVHLRECPMAQRLLVIKAIHEAAGMHGVTLPPWIGALMQPPAPSRPAADPTPSREQQKPADAPAAAPPTDSDERWLDKQLADMRKLTQLDDVTAAREQFYGLINAPAVQTFMRRLRREKRDLFKRGEDGFAAIIAQIDAKEEGGPPDDPSDPGPEVR